MAGLRNGALVDTAESAGFDLPIRMSDPERQRRQAGSSLDIADAESSLRGARYLHNQTGRWSDESNNVRGPTNDES